jgi:hypothetical protein
LKETRPLWPPQRGVGLQEPNLGKTNIRVSLAYSLGICFAPSLADSFIFLTLTRLVVVFIFVNISFRPIHPPSRRLSATFYILKTILSIRLEEFMLKNLIMLLIMLIFIVMRLLVLGIQLILRCLRKGLLMDQMNIAFHLRPLMHPLFLLTNPAK